MKTLREIRSQRVVTQSNDPAWLQPLPPQAAYVHVPFCRRRCFYCDFPVAVLGDRLRGERSGTVARYLEVLGREIAHTPVVGTGLKTVFFGGGTPSLLSVAQIGEILTALDQRFGLATEAEISMEIDPGTFSLAQLQGYGALGVNRVSVGVQAFQDNLLTESGRSHSVEDIERAVDCIHQAGIVNFNLDLISGLPHQTLAQWQTSLERAIALNPTHISCYDMTLEPGTAFFRRYEAGEAPLPTDSLTAQMYREAQATLTAAGFHHYEVSNYAKPGYACRHNRVYWQNQSYYGFGMGAASYVQRQRFTRPRKTGDYAQWVEDFVANSGILNTPIPSDQDVLLDTLMVGLRLTEGVSVNHLRQHFGENKVALILSRLRPFVQCGWVHIQNSQMAYAPEVNIQDTNRKETRFQETNTYAMNPKGVNQQDTHGGNIGEPDQRIGLTDPEGFLFSNQILADLFVALD